MQLISCRCHPCKTGNDDRLGQAWQNKKMSPGSVILVHHLTFSTTYTVPFRTFSYPFAPFRPPLPVIENFRSSSLTSGRAKSRMGRRVYRPHLIERPSMRQFVALSIVLHVLAVVLLGDASGNLRNVRQWGSFSAVLKPLAGNGGRTSQSANSARANSEAPQRAVTVPKNVPQPAAADASAVINSDAPKEIAPAPAVEAAASPSEPIPTLPLLATERPASPTTFVVPLLPAPATTLAIEPSTVRALEMPLRAEPLTMPRQAEMLHAPLIPAALPKIEAATVSTVELKLNDIPLALPPVLQPIQQTIAPLPKPSATKTLTTTEVVPRELALPPIPLLPQPALASPTPPIQLRTQETLIAPLPTAAAPKLEREFVPYTTPAIAAPPVVLENAALPATKSVTTPAATSAATPTAQPTPTPVTASPPSSASGEKTAPPTSNQPRPGERAASPSVPAGAPDAPVRANPPSVLPAPNANATGLSPAEIPKLGALPSPNTTNPPNATNPANPANPAPTLNLDALRQRARAVSSDSSGPRTLIPFPTAPKDPAKSSMEKIFDKALQRPDCKDAYKEMGLAAVLPLVRDALKEGGCKW